MKTAFRFILLTALVLALSLCGMSALACAPATQKLDEANVTVESAVAPAAPTAVPVATPAPETTMPPAKITGSAEGTVVTVQVNDIIINMANGNTISFMMNYITETPASPGDKVKIEYAGVITDRPEAVTVTVIEPAGHQSISGEVVMHDDQSIFIKISSQEIFGLVIDKDTKVTGKATSVVTGDTATVSFDGNLNAGPTAITIDITNAVKNRKEKQVQADTLTDKELDGYVTRLSGKTVSIRTSGKGRAYTFSRSSATNVSGRYDLTIGARASL